VDRQQLKFAHVFRRTTCNFLSASRFALI